MGKRVDNKPKQRRILPLVVFLAGLLLVVFAARALWTGWREDVSARNEYDELRSNFELNIESPAENLPYILESPAEDPRRDMSSFLEINPDFVGWLSIEGTALSYPVVQGQDNELYLTTTFNGERNPAGAIFMDYRALNAFDTPITMLHGHNMRDGSMFTSLPKYLDPEFLSDHPEITIVTAEGETLIYEVFHARRMSAWDPVYTLDFNYAATVEFFSATPAGTSRILLLSTCTSDGDRNARVLVYAALRTGTIT